MLGYLVDVAGKLLGHGKKGDDDTDAQDPFHCGSELAEQKPDARIEGAVYDKQTAGNDVDYIQEVADVHNNRSKHIGIGMGAVGILEKLVVQMVKILHGLVFMVENLDHLLPVHGFLNVALFGGERFLLADKEFCRSAAQFAGHQKHDNDAGNDNERQPNAIPKHDEEDADNNGDAPDERWQRLPDKLAERIDIVGIVAHDIAVLMRIEIANGKILHAVEHSLAHFGKETLRDRSGKLGFQRDRNEGKHIKAHQN